MTTHEMTVDDYLTLPYRISLIPDRDVDGCEGWVAEIDELPGCISQGATPEEAVESVRDAMAGWISVALEDGKRIPRPRDEHQYSGRFLVRLPRSLHGELARAAEDEGVSLNQLVQSALAAFVAARSGDAVRRHTDEYFRRRQSFEALLSRFVDSGEGSSVETDIPDRTLWTWNTKILDHLSEIREILESEPEGRGSRRTSKT